MNSPGSTRTMKNKTAKHPEPDPAESADPAETQTRTRGDAPEEPAVQAESADAAPDEQPDEATQWKERALRAQADLENFRKRMSREAAEIRRFANAALLEDLLPILDNFDLGLQAARQDEAAASIVTGMEMVRQQLGDFLNSQGVTEIAAEGAAFDPNEHDAVATEPSADVPEGTIIRVARRGFKLQDRVLRAPAVVVSKGPEATDHGGEG